MNPPRDGATARTSFAILFGALLGGVAAWYLDAPLVVTSPASRPVVRVVSTETGRPLPESVRTILGRPGPRAEAVRLASIELPGRAASDARIETTPSDGAEAVEIGVDHPDPRVAAVVAARLAERLDREIARALERASRGAEPLSRSGSGATGGFAGDPGDGTAIGGPGADDGLVPVYGGAAAGLELRLELDDVRSRLTDLREEARRLTEQELGLWSERTRAGGRLDAIREALDATPPTSLVRKKLIEDAALLGELDELGGAGPEDASRFRSLSIEEEIPNPVYVRLRVLEEEIIADGTGLERRLAEIDRERNDVNDRIELTVARERSLRARIAEESREPDPSRAARPDLDGAPSDAGAGTAPGVGVTPGGDASATATALEPVRVLHPVVTSIGPDAAAVERRLAGLGLGAMIGALLGWLASVLLSRGAGGSDGDGTSTPSAASTASATSAASAAGLAGIALLAFFAAADDARAQVEVGKPAPALEGSGVEWIGDAKSLEELRGRVVFLEFFQTTYRDYDRQISAIRDFLKRHEKESISYVGVVSGEKPAQVRSWIEEKGVAYPIVVDRYARVQGRYKIGQATLMILDPTGVVVWKGNPFTLRRVGDYELERALEAHRERARAGFLAATEHLLDDRYADAAAGFRRVLETDPRPEARAQAERFLAWIDARGAERMRLANALADAGSLAEALEVAQATAEQFAGLEVATDIGKLAARLKRNPGLAKQQRASKDEGRATELLKRADREERSGDAYAAYRALQSVVEKYPESRAAKTAKARIEEISSDRQTFEEIRAKEIDDRCSEWMNYARAYVQGRRYDDAREYIDRILELAPADSEWAKEARALRGRIGGE